MVIKTARTVGRWLAAVTWVASCVARVPESSDSAACTAALTASPDRLRRLTMTQYANSMRDLVRWVLGDGPDAATVIGLAALDALPSDRREPLPQDLATGIFRSRATRCRFCSSRRLLHEHVPYVLCVQWEWHADAYIGCGSGPR